MTFQEFEDIICWGYERMMEKGHPRNDGTSANTHPGRVVKILKNKGLVHYDNDAEDYMYSIVAFFHDMIEDKEATYEEIEEIAGTEVAKAVQILSKDKIKELVEGDTYTEQYIKAISKNELTRNVKLADRIENIRDSAGLPNKEEYIAETEKWFVGLAKGTVFEEDLEKALQELRDKVTEENKTAAEVR